MKISQQVSLLLSGTMALSPWIQARASDEDKKPSWPTAPVHQVPAQGWPESPKAPAGSPNVVLILLDDVGFGATSALGGPIQTPTFDRLAQNGLRYNSFHMNALCSPTRAALLTGRNNHQVGFGSISEWSAPYPGYNTYIPKSAATIAEVLKENGYSTSAYGKWHNTPTWQVNPAGPFDHWPTGLGFEHFYGFNQAADSQYYPRIFNDTTPVEPSTTPQEGYHFTTDITDNAIRWLHQHDAVANDKPFFIYYATGATHTPHHVDKKWVEKYKGKFDQGWDAIRRETFERQKKLGLIPANAEFTERPESLPSWASLTAQQKKLLAHEAEVYAGFLEQTDYEVGRLLEAVREEGKSDNTIVLAILGDNGASAEGGLEGTDARDINGNKKTIEDRENVYDLLGSELYYNHYAASWAWGLNSPFVGTKQDASHLGGTTDPLIISWPGHIRDVGGVRTQFSHVNDIAATIYELTGAKFPEAVDGVKQIPLEGKSLVYTFDNPNIPTRHTLQYFTTSGNRAIYKDGWWAGNRFQWTWESTYGLSGPGKDDKSIDVRPWELYNLNEDFSQAHNLADKYPEKLKELIQVFDAEATRNNAYPILPGRALNPASPSANKTIFRYHSGVDRLNANAAPSLTGRPYSITADVEIPVSEKVNGVILAQGGELGGVSLFVRENVVCFDVNAFANHSGKLIATAPLQPGRNHLELTVTPAEVVPAGDNPFAGRRPSPGDAELKLNGKSVGHAHFENVNISAGETLDIGSDLGSPVSNDYKSPGRFTGKIDQLTVELR